MSGSVIKNNAEQEVWLQIDQMNTDAVILLQFTPFTTLVVANLRFLKAVLALAYPLLTFILISVTSVDCN